MNETKVVAVIGIGYLGEQIATQTALCDYTVRLFDVRSDILEKTVKEIKTKKEEKGLLRDITYHNELSEAVADADLIIEAVPEKIELKKEIFSQIDKAAPPHAIIATNSSSIPVSKIEDAVERKDKLLNLHFYHLTITPMADIMRGTKTSDETFEKGLRYLKSINITPLIVKKECFGFVFNRIWRAIKKECIKIWAGGHADPDIVDQAWKIFTGMGYGPFTLMDMIGLDVVYDIEMSYYKESGDPNDKPPQALKDMVDRGELGRKSGKGFYKY